MLWEIVSSPSAIAGILSGILEGIGVPWPGALVLAAAGTKFHGWTADVLIATLFAVAYTASSALQYLIGRYCRGFIDRFLPEESSRKLDRTIKRYGQAAVLWTRPLAIGNYISIPAGMIRMHPGKFLVYTFTGIWPWAFGMTVAGSYLGVHLEEASEILIWLAGGMFAFGLATAIHKRWRRARKARESRASFSD